MGYGLAASHSTPASGSSAWDSSTQPDLVEIKSIIHGNVRGILSGDLHKLKTIHDLAISNKSFMINLTESHLNSGMDLIETELKGWEQVRCDRKMRLGGGVICYIKESLPICNSMTFLKI